VSPYEREDTVRERVRPGVQLPAVEVAFDVLAQCRNARITAQRIRLGCLAYDGVEIDAEFLSQGPVVEREVSGIDALIGAVWLPAAKQFGQQHTQRVHIDGSRRGVAHVLFGSGVRASQAPHLGARLFAFAGKEFGDAEIDQLDATIRADEHVAGLQVAMHDQAAMRMLDRGRYIDEQRKAFAQRQAALFAMRDEVDSGDKFEGEKRRSRR